MRYTLAGALAGLLLACTGNALAQGTPAAGSNGPESASQGIAAGQSGASADQLQEVVVTAKSLETQLPQQLAQYGTQVNTVSAAQILTGGYIDVAQALEAQTPGLYISSKNGPFDYVQISLQGSRTSDVLWLVDDIRINNRLYAGTTPLDTIPASMIERIEVLDGGQALFYGTQAVAGAVNIVTKSFMDHPDGSFNLGADSNNGKHLDGYFRDALDNNYFVVYGTHDESPGIQPFPTSDYQPSGTDRHRAYDVTTLGAKYGFNFTSDLAFSSLYQHTNAKVDNANSYLVAQDFNARDEDLVSAKLDYVPSDTLKLFAKGYYHRWSSYFTEYDNGTDANPDQPYTPGAPGQITLAYNDDYWGYKDYGLNLMGQFGLARGLDSVVGYDFQNYTGHDSVLVIRQETERVNAVFGQLRATPALIPDTHLAAGLRYNVPSVGPSAVVWNVGGQEDLPLSLYIKENVGTAFRLPTAEELFANDPDDERGDPNLKPETSTNMNASLGGTLRAGAPVHWEATVFYRVIHNLIDFQSLDLTTDQYVFGNVPGKVVERGEELTFDVPVTSSLSGTLDGTYSHSRQSGQDYQFDEIPLWQMKGGVDYHPAGLPFGLSAALVRVGQLYDQPFGSGEGRVGYGDYTVIDLSARVFLDAMHHQRIDVHVNNITNKVYNAQLDVGYTDADGTPYLQHDLGPPRTFSAYYTYTF